MRMRDCREVLYTLHALKLKVVVVKTRASVALHVLKPLLVYRPSRAADISD